MTDRTPMGENSDQDLESLARMYADDFDMDDSVAPAAETINEVSLEELSQAFARVIGVTNAQLDQEISLGEAATVRPGDRSETIHFPGVPASEPQISSSIESPGSANQDSDDEHFPVTPLSIVEAVLLIGRPDSSAITASEIASLMRGVTESEVDKLVIELNADYVTNHRAMRIAASGGGYCMQLADDLQSIRQLFLGPSRPVKLSQAAIDCLSLVSYQAGITREKLDEQLGKSSGSILNQLVRRQLLEIRREKDHLENKIVPRYYPTQRLLELVGLESLDDLPTAEEWVDPA